jgi:hypothetical protein
MPQIMTASWFAKLPAGTTPVGISRGVPREKSGYHRLRDLEPGPWFKSVSPDQYLTRYGQILHALDPNAIRYQLLGLRRYAGDALLGSSSRLPRRQQMVPPPARDFLHRPRNAGHLSSS